MSDKIPEGIRDIPCQYLFTSMWLAFFLVLIILLGGVIVSNLEMKKTCQEAVDGNLFRLCGGGCQELYNKFELTLTSGGQEYKLGCPVPEAVLKRMEGGGWEVPVVPGLNITRE